MTRVNKRKHSKLNNHFLDVRCYTSCLPTNINNIKISPIWCIAFFRCCCWYPCSCQLNWSKTFFRAVIWQMGALYPNGGQQSEVIDHLVHRLCGVGGKGWACYKLGQTGAVVPAIWGIPSPTATNAACQYRLIWKRRSKIASLWRHFS